MEINVDGSIEPKSGNKKRYGSQEKLLILSEITKGRTIEDVAEHYNPKERLNKSVTQEHEKAAQEIITTGATP